MADPQIDLSAGLVPNPQASQGAAQAPPPSIDLSAGFVPKPTNTPTFMDRVKQSAKENLEEPLNIASGFAKGAGQTVNSVSKLLNKIPVVGETLAPSVGVNAASNMETTAPTRDADGNLSHAGVAQAAGSGMEGVAEFVLGDEALKGLSIADKLGLASKIAKMGESNPVVSKLLSAVVTSLRQGAVGSGQSLLHGASPSEAAETGLISGGTGLALDTAANAVKSLAPGVKSIAGEDIPVRASENSKVGDAAEHVASSKPLSKFDVAQTQPAAKRAVGNVAKDAIKDAEAPSIASKGAELKSRLADLGLLTDDTTKKPVSSFGDAAKQLRDAAKPVYERLDELSGAEPEVNGKAPLTFSDLQKQETYAHRAGDFDAAKDAKQAQEDMINKYSDQFAPDDLDKARALTRQASALQDIHDMIENKATIETPVELRPKGTADPGYIRGQVLARNLRKMANEGTLAQAGLNSGHIQSLQDLSTLLENSANVHKLGGIMKGGGALEALMHPATLPTIAAAPLGASVLLGKLMTSPELTKTLVAGLKSGASTASIVRGIQAVHKKIQSDNSQ